MQKNFEIFTLAALLMLTACSSGGDDTQSPLPPVEPAPLSYLPLTFNATTADTESYTTRAAQTGAVAANALDKSFVVYGVKLTKTSADFAPQTVFAQTPVAYTANTAGTSSTNTADWEYVAGNEYIRYWDQLAEGYIFYGYAPSSLKGKADDYTGVKATASLGVAADKTKGTVTISNLQGGAKNPSTEAYLSLPTVVNPKSGQVAFQGAATMSFQQPLARIRIGFLSGEDNYSGYDPQNLQIKDVSFAPANSQPIIYKGSVTGTYDWFYNPPSSPSIPFGTFGCNLKYTSEQASGGENKKDALDFNNYAAYADAATCYTLNGTQYVEDALYAYATETVYNESDSEGDKKNEVKALSDHPTAEEVAAWQEKQWYYVFPQEAADWQLSIKTNVNGTEFNKTAIVPATYMHWLPNHQYTYIFKVSPQSLSIVGVDVKVIDWQPGGSTESEQHHW